MAIEKIDQEILSRRYKTESDKYLYYRDYLQKFAIEYPKRKFFRGSVEKQNQIFEERIGSYRIQSNIIGSRLGQALDLDSSSVLYFGWSFSFASVGLQLERLVENKKVLLEIGEQEIQKNKDLFNTRADSLVNIIQDSFAKNNTLDHSETKFYIHHLNNAAADLALLMNAEDWN